MPSRSNPRKSSLKKASREPAFALAPTRCVLEAVKVLLVLLMVTYGGFRFCGRCSRKEIDPKFGKNMIRAQ
jgi:hypothetical protein